MYLYTNRSTDGVVTCSSMIVPNFSVGSNSMAIFADGAAYDDIAAALEGYKDYIAAQTLALSVTLGKDAPEGAADVEWDEGSVKMVLSR